MRSDPRCPACAGKVSSTATWCMHCGEDFPTAVDADSGRPVQDRATEKADYEESVDGGSSDATTVGFLVAIVGLVTLPFATPPNMLLFYAAAAVGSGIYAARQASLREAASKGGLALAVAPWSSGRSRSWCPAPAGSRLAASCRRWPTPSWCRPSPALSTETVGCNDVAANRRGRIRHIPAMASN
ncbi:hypothetical protein ACFQER_10665 [Halomicroarcula sp. GCM10025894]|uniref:hypothetical protein n=1 Tax=Halomicroarcula sp. GCM10025894 TaxID=3252673 RepID=UPI00360F6A33